MQVWGAEPELCKGSDSNLGHLELQPSQKHFLKMCLYVHGCQRLTVILETGSLGGAHQCVYPDLWVS